MARKIIQTKEIDWTGLTAYTIVLGFLVIVGATAIKGDIQTMTLVSSILGPFAGVVCTFFFGIKKLQHILLRLEALKE